MCSGAVCPSSGCMSNATTDPPPHISGSGATAFAAIEPIVVVRMDEFIFYFQVGVLKRYWHEGNVVIFCPPYNSEVSRQVLFACSVAENDLYLPRNCQDSQSPSSPPSKHSTCPNGSTYLGSKPSESEKPPHSPGLLVRIVSFSFIHAVRCERVGDVSIEEGISVDIVAEMP